MLKYFSILFFSIFIFSVTQAQTFSGTGGSIPDAAPPVNFSLTVSGLSPANLNQTHGLVQVCLTITHTYDGDLNAKLIAPDGSIISLFNNVGGGGDNFTNTCFDSSAAPSIGSGSAPFTGTFLPHGNLGNVNNNQNGNGIWTLQVQDMAGADTGSVVSWQITFGNNAPTPLNIATDIPLVVITTNGQTIPNGSKIFANMKVIDNGVGNLNHASDVGNVFTGNIAIGVRGAFSASLPQQPYSVTTLKQNLLNDTNVVFFNMPKEHDWVLLAAYNDKSFVRNTLVYKLFGEMGHYAARTKHCEVVLDGQYIGVYIFMEKIKRDGDRVDIAKMKASDVAGDSLTGGFIFKHDYSAPGWTSAYSPVGCNTRFYDFNFEYPKADSIQPQQANYIHHFIDTLENRLYGTQPADSVWGYRPLVNTVSFADYLIINELAWNGDGYKKSMYFYKDKNSKDSLLHAGPVWDFDWALKRMPWTPTDYSGWYYTANPCDGDVLFLPWWNVMMQDTLFQNEVRCHWDYYREHTFSTLAINHYIDSMAAMMNNAQQRHFNTWQILGINVGTPESAPFATSYQEEIDTLKSILAQRMNWMDVNLPGHCYKPYNPNPQPSGLKQIANGNEQLIIYPNPVNDYLRFNDLRFMIAEIQVMDLLGRVRISINNQQSQIINVSALSPGVYFIKVTDIKGNRRTGKFVKQ